MVNEFEIVKKFTKILGLDNKTDGSLYFYKSKTRDPKKPDGYYVKDGVRFLLDAKAPNKKFENQLESYMKYESQLDDNFIGFKYDGNKFECYIKGKLKIDENIPQNADYYISKYKFKISTQTEIVANISEELANMFRIAKINKQNNVPFIGAVMLCCKFNKEINNTTTKGVLALIKSSLDDIIKDNPLQRKQKKEFLKRILDDDTLQSCDIGSLSLIIEKIQTIYTFINVNEYKGHDTMNNVLKIFRKWNSIDAQEKGQVFTPDHIAQLMYKLIDCNKNDVILDPTCGSGTFLTNAMANMLNEAKEHEKQIIKENNLIGIESDGFNATLAGINMMLHGDGASNIFKDDCFRKLPEIKDCFNKSLMNPPFGKGFDPLNFVLQTLNNMKKNGMCASILPISHVLDKNHKQIRNELTSKHGLIKSVLLPNNLFFPNAQIATCILIFKAHVLSNQIKAYDYTDDGYEIKMRIGREPINDKIKIDEFWKQEPKILGIDDEWIINKDFDFNSITKLDFIKTKLDFIKTKLDFITINKDLREEIAQNNGEIKLNILVKKINLNIKYWKRFKIRDLGFVIDGKGKDTAKNAEEGTIPLIIAKKNNNGVGKLIKNPRKVFSGNKLAVVSQGDGGSGMCYYQKEKFAATSSILVISNRHINEFNGLFISTVMSKVLKLRYSHDRHLTTEKFFDETILLPQTKDGEPDWEFMENFMNSNK